MDPTAPPGDEHPATPHFASLTAGGTLAGTLGSFAPAPGLGDAYALFTYGELSEAFDEIDLPDLPDGLGWGVTFEGGLALATVLDATVVCLPSEFEQTVDRVNRRLLLTITDSAGIARVDFTDPEGTPVLEGLVASSPQMTSADGIHFLPNQAPLLRAEFTLEATADRGRYFARIQNECGVETVIDPETDFSTSMEDVEPVAFGVEQNYPNPFYGQTSISFRIEEASQVRVAVYDFLGREVVVLQDAPLGAGSHTVVWDGLDAGGRPVASGAYLYRVEAGRHAETRRMTLLTP